MKTALKSILVFQNGEFLKQINYKTKAQAIGNYKLFRRFGILDPETLKLILNATFELL